MQDKKPDALSIGECFRESRIGEVGKRLCQYEEVNYEEDELQYC